MKDNENHTFLIVSGESSGDLLGGALAAEIFQKLSTSRIFGVGGRAMHAAGVEMLQTIDNMGVTGFTEVVLKLRPILNVMKRIVDFARRNQPDVVILIDYPDFNLRLAPKLKRLGIPVLYYVSPQLWAWRSYRVKTIRRYVDRMMTLFPFEETWYRDRGVDAVFTGHPVVKRTDQVLSREKCRLKHGFNDDIVIAMMPGSRQNEVMHSLPVFVEAAGLLRQSISNRQLDDRRITFVIPLADTIRPEELPGYECFLQSKIRIVQGETLSVVKGADFAWVTSGTAVLETALLGTPHVVVYKTSPFSYFLAKTLVRVKYISAANLVIDDCMAPELIQNDFTPERLVAETEHVLFGSKALQVFAEKQALLRKRFGQTDASVKAAEVVLDFVRKSRHRNGVSAK